MDKKPSSLGLKKNKYTNLFLVFILFFIVASSIPAGIVYASSLDSMVPSDTNKDANYNKYGMSHYSFQTVTGDHHFWQVGAAAKDSVVGVYDQMLSGGFLITVQVTRFFNFVAREAFTFSFMDELIDAVSIIIRNVTGVNGTIITPNGLFDSLGGIAIMVTVIYILWLVVRTRFLDGLQQSFSFLIALIICMSFFAYSGSFLKTANGMVNSVGSVMYIGLAKATGLNTSSQDGVTVISEQVWEELVVRPYTMLQFDSTDVSTKDPVLLDGILKTEPFSDEREAALIDAAPKYPAVATVRSSEQMILIIVYFIFSLFILGLFCYWALTTIYMRLKLLVHASVMSVTLLASLLPGRDAGIAVLRSQFIKLIGYSVVTTMTMFFLDLSLVMGHLVYDVVAVKAKLGWFTGLFLEAVIVLVIFKYRNEMGSVFAKASGVPAQVAKQKNTVLDALQRNVTRTLYNSAANKVSGLFNRTEREGVPTSFSPGAISRADTNLNDATSSSMMLRFQREKQAAEEIAAEKGESVQYTPYVQRVNDNLRNGTKNPFRGMDKDWKEEKSRLSEVQEDGGNMKQAILTQGVHEGMNDQEAAAVIYGNEHAIRKAATYMVERPKRVDEQMARVQTLNRNRKLQTSVDDFCMIQLFDRYKVDYKQAIDSSNVSGNPVKHSDFVKNMDSRFRDSGLTNTNKINNAMLHKNSRLSIAPNFEDMNEFKQYKMDLLHANEALMKVKPPTEGIYIPLSPLHFTAPASTDNILSMMPKLPGADIVSQMKDRNLAIRSQLEQKSVTVLPTGGNLGLKTITDNTTRIPSTAAPYQSSRQTSQHAVTQEMEQNVNVTRKKRILVKTQKGSINDGEVKSILDTGQSVLKPLQSTKAVTASTVRQRHLYKVKVDRQEEGLRVHIMNPVSKLPKSSNLGLNTKSDNAIAAPIQSSRQTSQHAVTQEMEQKFNGTRKKRVLLNTNLGLKTRSDNAIAAPIQSSRQTSQHAVTQEMEQKFNVTRKKRVLLNTKKESINNGEVNSILNKGQNVLQPLHSTKAVTSSSIQQRHLYKVKVDRQEEGLRVQIMNPVSKGSSAPTLPGVQTSTSSIQQKEVRNINVQRSVVTNLGIKTVNIKDAELKSKMEKAKEALNPKISNPNGHIEINTVEKQRVALQVKQKISHEVSMGLEDELTHLKTMDRARQIAPVSQAAESISQLVQSKAQMARQNALKNKSGEHGK